MRSVVPRSGFAAPNAPTPATVTGPASGIPGPARSALAILNLRQGGYFPDWLLEGRRRAEAALVTVVATSYLLGVSTRRMEKLVETRAFRRVVPVICWVNPRLCGAQL